MNRTRIELMPILASKTVTMVNAIIAEFAGRRRTKANNTRQQPSMQPRSIVNLPAGTLCVAAGPQGERGDVRYMDIGAKFFIGTGMEMRQSSVMDATKDQDMVRLSGFEGKGLL